MAPKAVVIPLDGGQDTTVDKRLAGLARFRSVVNGRLDADGRVISRPRYQQLAQTTFGTGTFLAYDLFELDGRLCALGDRLGLGFPTDVFEFVNRGVAWRPTDATGTLPRLPRATRMRDMPRPPDQEDGANFFDVAASSGCVLFVYSTAVLGQVSYAHLIDATSAQTVLVRKLTGSTQPVRAVRAVGLTTRLWHIGINLTRVTVRADRFDPASSTGWTSAASALITDVAISLIDAAKVGGVEQFVVAAWTTGGDLIVRRFDSDGVVVVPSGGQYATVSSLTTVTHIAVEADSTGNTVNVAVTDGGTIKVYCYNLATGATLGAPPFTPTEASGQTSTNVSLVRASSSSVLLLASVTTIGTPDLPRVLRWAFDTTARTFGTGVPVLDSKLTTHGVFPDTGGSTAVYGILRSDTDTTPNMLIAQGTANNSAAPLATTELGFAGQPSVMTPHIGVDLSATPRKYYWARSVEASNGDIVPMLSEFMLSDPSRRQVARSGRAAIIAGSCPTWYDGSQLVELGFTQRPRIVSLTSSNGAGTLLTAGEYSYATTHSWLDALGRLHRSPVSLPEDVTLGASDDTVTAVVSSVISLRQNEGTEAYGSAVREELYRTRLIRTTTPASMIGTALIDPPQTVLNTLTLNIFSSSGGSDFVTFGAGDTTKTAILATINGVTGAGVVATGDGGVLELTTSGEGETAFIFVSGTALTALGLTAGTVVRGTSEDERGEVLHQTATGYRTVADDSGNQDSITDTRNDGTGDTELASQAVIYTQLDEPLNDHAPPPADYVWVGSERIFVAGLPNRSAWRASKTIDDIRAPAFAPEGRAGFGGELVEAVEAIVVQDTSQVLFTRRGVWQVDGQGPAANGQGGFAAARRVFTDGGIVANGWRSLLETAKGTWFQLGSDKLYLMPPGGSPEWAGYAIRELLQDFPVIVAACLTANDQMAAFALQNTGGTAGRIALLDLRRGVWYVDDVGAVPQALADFGGRLCYVDENHKVWRADAAAGTGTFIPLTVITGNATEFDVAGQGAVSSVMLVGELLGECTLELQVDYDDGAGFVTAGTFALTVANGYAVGQTIRQEFMLAQQDTSSFALSISTTGNSDSAGLALVAIVAFADRDSGPALLGSRFRR